MENEIKTPVATKIYGITIDDSFEDYRNHKHFAKKLAKINQMIENGEMPSFVYENQAATYADALSSADSLMVAHEPQTEYGKKKEIEE